MKKTHWIATGIGVAAAAVAAWLIVFKRKDTKEKPPKGAPQLQLHNPGDQSNFPNSASESEIG